MNTETLLALAKAYASHTGLKLSTVSTYAAGDGKFFANLEDGAGCTLRRAHNLLKWFSSNWPHDLKWPQGVQRPPKSKEAA
ncbi:hypothetical protein [Paracoccus denitrificans]|uniref:hypothetical protein n=1 Tax=Paracoccus denitrificans TaxID=266 RepID=UPI001E5FF3E1|nr:hypothetical protein [Paracoccus denitrificans]UFS63807.1 hypothetical protein LO749_06350 [Paracoccus denitrificans]